MLSYRTLSLEGEANVGGLKIKAKRTLAAGWAAAHRTVKMLQRTLQTETFGVHVNVIAVI